MKNGLLKYSFLLLAVVIALVVFSFQNGQNIEGSVKNLDSAKLLAVNYLDVGQGDAIYIRTPDEIDVLIDGGPDKSVLNELGKVMPFWDKEIDLMILTHPHSDHVGGLVEVLRRYKVKQILYTGVVHTTPDYLAWLAEIKEQKINMNIVDKLSIIQLGSLVELQLLYPQKSFLNTKIDNLNNSSIVARLVYDGTSFLFTGDIEKEVESELLRLNNTELNSDVLKVAHHGSETATSTAFLEAVDPQYAIIQCGKDNGFNHPHGKVLYALETYPVSIFRTDAEGTISLISDGVSLVVQN